MRLSFYIIISVFNLLSVEFYAQTIIDSTNIDSLLHKKKEEYYVNTFTLEDSIFKEGAVFSESVSFYDARLHINGKKKVELLFLFLKDNKNITIEISNYTDYRGSSLFNSAISNRRSEAIESYLVAKGIKSSRLKSIGYGESHPIITEEEIKKLQTKNLQEKAHAINRRTEFKIIRIN